MQFGKIAGDFNQNKSILFVFNSIVFSCDYLGDDSE